MINFEEYNKGKSEKKVESEEISPINSFSMGDYGTYDRTITFNDNDPDLIPIVYTLPTPPSLDTIDGFGLPKEQQYFRRVKIPSKLIALNREPLTSNQKIMALESNPDYYADEIAFIEQEWKRAEHGYWFYNFGRPTYISNYHYLFLTYWHIQNPDSPLPFFCMFDREVFLFIKMTFDDVFCVGLNFPKHRRAGATSIAQCVRYFRAIMNRVHHSAMQSMDEDSAKTIHNNHMVYAWDKMIFWFKPVDNNNTKNTQEILFYTPRFKNNPDYGVDSIESRITYKSSEEGAYDGDVVNTLHNDEVGKCFRKGTPILMYDGRIKKIEDVVVGDILMGDDSTPRNVLSLAHGHEEMFSVQPKKGMEWGCNESHILSLKWCQKSQKFRGASKGDVVNITVLDYLTQSKNSKKHLMLYRVGSEYKEKSHKIPPYIIGIWIGDGSKYGTGISTIDPEISNEITKYAKEIGLSVTENKNKSKCSLFSISSFGGRGGKMGCNPFRTGLKFYNLLENKHIPEEYLFDSRENRLQLLAGLIDTDGYKYTGDNKQGYEIIQKEKVIADAIYTLATGLGFYCSKKEKIASMKRADGSMYYCPVYRMSIFGNNLHEIPCRIERKKQRIISVKHKNTRNPMHSGFSVVPQGVGEYFGFCIDGNRLFQLSDGTVVHNTVNTNIYDRWGVQRLTLMRGTRVIGKSLNTSTVEEMERKGGGNFKQLCDESHFQNKDPLTRMTTSGLYNLFIPAYEKMDGENPLTGKSWIDKYGFHDPQAEGYIHAQAKQFEVSGNTEARNNHYRRYPCVYRDSWRPAAKNSPFNLTIINNRLDKIETYTTPLKKQGDFEWYPGFVGSRAYFKPSPEGRFWISWDFDTPEKANNRRFDPASNLYYPANTHMFIAGADPIGYRLTQGYRQSKAAFAIKYKLDFSDNIHDTPPELWKSDRLICTYLCRTETPEEACVDWMKACCYFGCQVYPENNINVVNNVFLDNGYARYLYFDQKEGGKFEVNPGDKTDQYVKENIFARTQKYIVNCAVRCCHDEYLKEVRDITSVDDMTKFDLFTAVGYALLGEYKDIGSAMPALGYGKPQEVGASLDDVLFDYGE